MMFPSLLPTSVCWLVLSWQHTVGLSVHLELKTVFYFNYKKKKSKVDETEPKQ